LRARSIVGARIEAGAYVTAGQDVLVRANVENDHTAAGTGDLRIISVTATSLAGLVTRGEFLEGLFRRLSAVQFDLTTGECSA